MGCKFSIALEQQKPQTPSWFSERNSRRKVNTEETPPKEADLSLKKEQQPPDADESMSSPEQVELKSLKNEQSQEQPPDADEQAGQVKSPKKKPASLWKP